ncbi:DUF2075 domain-containing protein [Microbacterium caowuchunii]|uniref:DUF2075 domain-containing protein n=1 Tax=Microbacterium caowuchunii TaxID=2614638 RepID=A0A5N0TM23_9MICO|nr:DUF2075 domain-containing protein [Microbacterium caowuchunii]KAA9136203.1 DUF2075 domain-containing protein [Microbacterium caowuchunii]
MTPFEIEQLRFASGAISEWALGDERRRNWPVVYVLEGAGDGAGVYVGETVNAATRMRQHLANPAKRAFQSVRVVIDETFNKSACLDLESHLIRWLAGDGHFTVMNGNEGIIDARYYERDLYRESFRDVFEELRAEGIFQRSIPEIENSDLFKLSPFKVLTPEQAIAVEDIVEGLLEDLGTNSRSMSVIEGHPGTGKTIVAIFLMKLLADIRDYDDADEIEPDSMFADFFVSENRDLLRDLRIGFVVPQQSLRESIKRVFKKTPKVSPDQILTPFDVGASEQSWDVLIVDETHRLNQRANQSSGVNNKRFVTINEKLFGADDLLKTQLDWIKARSAHQIYLLDAEQTVRPADLPRAVLRSLVTEAQSAHRRYPLSTQMRVRAGADYVEFVRAMLRGESSPQGHPDFGDYDLRLFDDLGEMRREILARDSEHGLSRLVAGYAWEWKSARDRDAFDIEVDGLQLRWNSQAKDWINSPSSIHEVGSIHTVQGYDLNYAGVIIGDDLRFDPDSRRLFIDRDSYRDAKGKENNKQRGISYSDDDLLEFIRNIYGVLLTRGMRGTYVYVCDRALRGYIADVLGP